MTVKACGTLAVTVASALALFALSGCGSSGDTGPSLQDIPRYPNATERESMAQSMGPLSASLVQLTTTDTHDKVLDFYTKALKDYDTETVSYALEDGRQTAISIAHSEGKITVAIQEFIREGAVAITHMRVGS